MTLSVATRAHVGIVVLDGACFGGSEGPALRAAFEELRQTGRTNVVLDLFGSTHLDSAGIGVLIEEATALRTLGGDLHLAGVAGAMRNEPLLARLLGQVFALYATVLAAADAFAEEDARRALASAAVSA